MKKAVMSGLSTVMVILLGVVVSSSSSTIEEVGYDGRSLIINGTRRILFSGSIHYPRSTSQMWPTLISRAKKGGINVIQTYVFWNIHEPVKGQFDFEGRYDLVAFIKEIQSQGLYVSLRIGPFIESEWKYGGFPFWLREVPGIVFRTDNEPFKYHMKRYASNIVNMMKTRGLYASQGGPIILTQIENEYQNIKSAFSDGSRRYVNWAAEMAVGLKTGVPWMMCKQDDVPGPVINACNGMRCGETFVGPNSPNKPALWTENWTSFLQTYGTEPLIRSSENIAFNVALFISAKKGSFVNYYMYHGGTNFGRVASSYVITGYYDHAPLDEYGMIQQPMWGHLRELHAVITLCSDILLHGTYKKLNFGGFQKGYIFQHTSAKCVAFIVNNDKKKNAVVLFNNRSYELPKESISILPDCKNVIFNTAKVTAQHTKRLSTVERYLSGRQDWEGFMDEISNNDKKSFSANILLDQMNATKDETDYFWYSIRSQELALSYNEWWLYRFSHKGILESYESTKNSSEQYTLNVVSHAHVVHAFVNNIYIGNSYYRDLDTKATIFEKKIHLKHGRNDISLLNVMVGSPDSGAHLERISTGIRRVRIKNSNNELKDISNHLWGYKVGLLGENLKIYSEEGLRKVVWEGVDYHSTDLPLMWYKMTFKTPKGNNPVVLNLTSMGKGEVWVNGESIGRYWVSFKTPRGRPSQSLYHVPSSFMKPSRNLLVIFEEMGGNPRHISIETVSVTTVCGSVSDSHPPSLFTHRYEPTVRLQCRNGENISAIKFASYGTPIGNCNNYTVGNCHFSESKHIVEKKCLGRRNCSIDVLAEQFTTDPCPGFSKSLLVSAQCN